MTAPLTRKHMEFEAACGFCNFDPSPTLNSGWGAESANIPMLIDLPYYSAAHCAPFCQLALYPHLSSFVSHEGSPTAQNLNLR